MAALARLAGDLPFVQKAFFRNIVAFFVSLSILVKLKIRNNEKINVPKGAFKYLFTRALAGTLGVFGNFYAIDRIPIADAAILNKMSPFFAIVFSLFLLGEKIAPVPFAAVIAAFCGSIFIVKPSVHILDSLPAIAGFLGGAGAGLAYTCVRKLGYMKTTGALVIVFFSTFSCVFALPFIIFNLEPMTLTQVLILIGAGVAATGGQFGITYAYYNAPARDISIYDYTQIIFSSALGFFMFGQIPDVYSIIGYVIIISMAVLVFVYNKRKAL